MTQEEIRQFEKENMEQIIDMEALKLETVMISGTPLLKCTEGTNRIEAWSKLI